MDYEKKYKETLEKARQLCVYPTTKPFISDLQDLFPELKESEDERIRKDIKQHFLYLNDSFPDKAKWLAWLEKQGKKEQDARYEDLEELLAADDIYQMAMNDEMVREAKSKAINALSELQISKLLGLEKQGEVPVTINIDKMVEDYANNEECDNEGFGKPVNCMIRAYRQGLTDAIVILNLRKQDEQNLIMAKSPHLGEQKPAWSKEDEERLKETLAIIDTVEDINKAKDCFLGAKTWLKSLKDRVQPQPKQEENKGNLGGISSNWSEEDERTIQGIIDEIAANKSEAPEYDIETYDRFLTWLKSLRPQPKQRWSEEDETGWTNTMIMIKEVASNHYTKDSIKLVVNFLKSLKDKYTWKPSKKQMEALKDACDEHWEPDGLDPLYTLYQELKKLREE